MLYSGVEFDRSSFKVTVLSETYARLAEKRFYISPPPAVLPWLAQFKNNSDEPVRWYFDQDDWNHDEYATNYFNFTDSLNSIFLVNHRAFSNLIQFLLEWRICQNCVTNQLPRSMLLASVSRFFCPQQLKPLTPLQ